MVILAIVSLGLVAATAFPLYYWIAGRRRQGERPSGKQIAAFAAVDLLFFLGMVLWLLISG